MKNNKERANYYYIVISIFIAISYMLFFIYLYINHTKLDSSISFYKEVIESEKIPKKIKLINKDGKIIYFGKTFHYCLDIDPTFRCILFLDQSANIHYNDVILIDIDDSLFDNFLFKELNHSQVISIDAYQLVIPKNKQEDAVKEIAQFSKSKIPLNSEILLKLISFNDTIFVNGSKEFKYIDHQLYFPERRTLKREIFKINLTYYCDGEAMPKFILSDKKISPSSIVVEQTLSCNNNQTEQYFFTSQEKKINTITLRNESNLGSFVISELELYSLGEYHPSYKKILNID